MPIPEYGWNQEVADLIGASRRITGLFAFFALSALLIAMRFWFLQIVNQQYYLTLAETNRSRLLREPAFRGEICDRHGRILVNNQASYDLTLVLEDLGGVPLDEVLHRLCTLVNLDIEFARQKIKEVGYRVFQPVTIKRHLTFGELATIEAHKHELPGVDLSLRPRRAYRLQSLAANTLGYIGAITSNELKTLKEEGYYFDDLIGKMGLEKNLDQFLRGERGEKYVEVNAHGRVLKELYHPQAHPPVPGYRVYTTLDMELQQYIEGLMTQHAGVVIAQDPRNGEILALVNSPAFDPNIFSSGGGAALIQEISRNPHRPLRNRAIQDAYPPGSMFKIVMATAGLETDTIKERSGFSCSGTFFLGSHAFRCWKSGGHGTVSIHDAIRISCNVFFYNLGQRLGVNTIADYAQQFGFGRLTGIQLPYEFTGRVPDPRYLEERRKRLGFDWFPGDTVSLSIGQGEIAITPLQALNIATTIAGNGRRYVPRLVSKYIPPNKGEPIVVESTIDADLHLKPETITIIKKAMWAVVNDGGTATRVAVPGLNIAGKTGTAQVASQSKRNIPDDQLPERLRDHAWFVSFAPVDDPKLALIVLLNHGGKVGARKKLELAKEIYTFYLGRVDQSTPQLSGAAL